MKFPALEHPYWRKSKTEITVNKIPNPDSKTNIRNLPSLEGDIVKSISNDSDIYWLKEGKIGPWIPVKLYNIHGWVHQDFMNFKDIDIYLDDFPEKGCSLSTKDSERVNLRSAPSLNSKVVGKLYQGDLFRIIGATEKWFQIHQSIIDEYVWAYKTVVTVDCDNKTETSPFPLYDEVIISDEPTPLPEGDPPIEEPPVIDSPEVPDNNGLKEGLFSYFPLPEFLASYKDREFLALLLEWIAMILRNSDKLDEFEEFVKKSLEEKEEV